MHKTTGLSKLISLNPQTMVVEDKKAEAKDSDSDNLMSAEGMSLSEKTPVERQNRVAKEKGAVTQPQKSGLHELPQLQATT